jgi:hypothetical protein
VTADVAKNPDAPYYRAAAIIPTDTTTLFSPTRGVYVGGAGALKVVMEDETEVTFAAVPVGTVLRIRCVRVFSTGTTATNLVALY